MRDVFEAALFEEELTPEERDALRQALSADPDLAQRFRDARTLRAHLRGELDAALPDRTLLVLHALHTAGRTDLLSEAELSMLDSSRPALERAFATYPALLDVSRRIAAEAGTFDDCWEACFSPARAVPAARMDRAPKQPVRRANRWVWRTSVGAAVLAFAVIGGLLVQRDSSMVTVRAEGQTTLVALDGAAVRLMPGASLTYSDPARKAVFDRQARLSGDAFFEVTPGQGGFVVETASARLTVLGTSFGVRASGDLTEVTLVDGRMTVAPIDVPTSAIALAPGEQSRVQRGALPTTPQGVDLDEALAWSGLLLFRDTPLSSAITQLETRFGVDIEVRRDLAAQQVTGTFEATQPVEEVLRALALTLGADVTETKAGRYRLE